MPKCQVFVSLLRFSVSVMDYGNVFEAVQILYDGLGVRVGSIPSFTSSHVIYFIVGEGWVEDLIHCCRSERFRAV